MEREKTVTFEAPWFSFFVLLLFPQRFTLTVCLCDACVEGPWCILPPPTLFPEPGSRTSIYLPTTYYMYCVVTGKESAGSVEDSLTKTASPGD